MKWFIACLVFEIDIEDYRGTTQYDESYRLVQARSQPQALNAALLLAHNEESRFINHKGKNVHWKFCGLKCLFEIDGPLHGAQVSAHTHIPDDGAIYRNTISLFTEAITHSTEYLWPAE